MVDKVMISLSGRNQKWFDSLPKKEKSAYLKSHPNSKFGNNGIKKKAKTATKGKTAKPAAKAVKIKKAAAKRPKIDDKAKTKKAAPAAKKAVKKAAPAAKKKPRKKPEVKVHNETSKLHEHAMTQKKAMIDKLIAPYARELGQLRNKRDGGGGLSNEESQRYKALLETISKLHQGRNH